MSADPSTETQKPSQVPSWIMVGFAAGLLTMWGFQSGGDHDDAPAPAETTLAATASSADSPPEKPRENPLSVGDKPSMEMVQELFAGLRDWAFWTDDRTEFAVWNGTTMSFSDHFEVIRLRDADYFRAIPGFSRLPIDGYGPEHSPILFTETAEQRAKRFFEANPDKRPPPPAKPQAPEFNTLPPPPSGR
ncbi:hypothetical protein [Actomonas aquatica]|uniref:Uncharacterized protein n=1 Tax=Actomonas aquatica TaxID=2866162 RepID=A0ABZ1CD93_9BACT|nr:hypothetical protein [Opitutus sp. WL0086]WRQ89635.1 hypothetical protein K1X11_009455 [Opitutus sp. WL0086]